MTIENTHRDDMNIVIVGHVDHGKSTIIGRLLADTGSLPDGKLEQVKETCRKNSKPFEYAFLLDALKDEQAQGITIDSARCFFKTEMRDYIIIDAPGHIEFLKNMVTGASRAEAALLVIDANEGIKENSKRHGYLLSMLGIKRIAVVVNKMDLVDYSEDVYNNIVKEYSKFLKQIDIEPLTYIPVSGFFGANIKEKSSETPWYNGKSVLELLDSLEAEKSEVDKAFRMPVQDVYKFTKDGDDRRIVAGTIETGTLSVGDEVIFEPSGKRSVVKSIEDLTKTGIQTVSAGQAVGFTLEEQIYIKRGELASLVKESNTLSSSTIKANIFWLGKEDLKLNKEYFIKIGSAKVKARLKEVLKVVDASDLNNSMSDHVKRHEVAEIVLETSSKIAFDLASENAKTSRFVLIDNYEIAGGGIVLDTIHEENNIEEIDIHKELELISLSIAKIQGVLQRKGIAI